MGIKDLIVTPLLIVLIYFLAYSLRNRLTDPVNRKYFIPGLTLKIIGAIALGVIYQYYYEGGDTFAYFSGSGYIWQAFHDSPLKAIRLLLANGEYNINTYEYASKIIYYNDLPSYFVIRIAGLFDLITFHTYSATATLFALLSFSGLWALYLAMYRMFRNLHLQIAIAVFFIPSVFFWGSGLLKDSLTLGALGWATYAFTRLFFERRSLLSSIIILFISCAVIYQVKIYILLCFLPALLIWLYFSYIKRIKNLVIKVMLIPFSVLILVWGGYYSVREIGQENRRYSLESLTNTAEATARWLSFVSIREGGSGYTLGDFDYSPAGILKKTPAAIWVTLFRPYLWESKNPVMFLSALESFGFLLITLIAVFYTVIRGRIGMLFTHPTIIFCFAFAISFSFAIGISTYNFGSLVRYKIPMMPFYLIGLFILLHYSKRRRKLVRFAVLE